MWLEHLLSREERRKTWRFTLDLVVIFHFPFVHDIVFGLVAAGREGK